MELLTKDEYVKSFRGISASLRRKFVKKINTHDALACYDSLSKEQVDLGFLELGADCKLAAAFLDNQNTTPGIFENRFIESARLYALNKDQILSSSCYSSGIMNEESNLTWLTATEAGNSAFELKDYKSAYHFFTRALNIAKGKTEKELSIKLLVSSLIHQDLFAEALKVFEKHLSCDEASSESRLTVLILHHLVKDKLNDHDGIQKFVESLSTLNVKTKKQVSYRHHFILFPAILDPNNIDNMWKYLNSDQKYLLTKYLCSDVVTSY